MNEKNLSLHALLNWFEHNVDEMYTSIGPPLANICQYC